MALDADPRKGGDELHRGLDMWHHGFKLLGEKVGPEPLRNVVYGEQLKVVRRLIRAEHQAGSFLTEIAEVAIVLENRELRQARPSALDELGNRLGDHVLMNQRDRRIGYAEHASGTLRVIACGDDHVLAGDRSRRRPDLPFVAGRPFEADDLGVAVDLGAAIARALSERLGHVGGSDMAVLPMVEPAKDAPAMLDERPQLPDLVRRQDL